jgi:hypothetical protein
MSDTNTSAATPAQPTPPATPADQPELIVKPKTVREMLDVIDVFLTENRNEPGLALHGYTPTLAAQLWDVLSALRGPDSSDLAIKSKTTIPIRRAAFPRLTAEIANDGFSNTIGAAFGTDEPDFEFRYSIVSPPLLTNFDGYHFAGHAKLAAEVLGIFRD